MNTMKLFGYGLMNKDVLKAEAKFQMLIFSRAQLYSCYAGVAFVVLLLLAVIFTDDGTLTGRAVAEATVTLYLIVYIGGALLLYPLIAMFAKENSPLVNWHYQQNHIDIEHERAVIQNRRYPAVADDVQ